MTWVLFLGCAWMAVIGLFLLSFGYVVKKKEPRR